ncbi:hypothetical protein GN244_ATG02444 [Phytophthora infestans]|uniref:Uncharacterized protein n=1 Tax=Phytophthora infestans TaxID=4787 RepID=A0A833T0T4_PHYIN|nr:hypothetical protein GN244_ATG02444 [Phytophthora infestans]KAF4127176.1 hypothetical protein GN958_ATG23635 [Phytophthora infestans]
MMSESNNLLYHPQGGGFDRLEEMEGGALTRYPVLRSVPVPPRPWSTRGAIALLMVCGVIFGVIAIATLNGSSSETTTADTAEATSADGVSIIGGSGLGSGSFDAGTVKSDSSWMDGSGLSSKADGDLTDLSNDTSVDAASYSTAASQDSQQEESASGSDDSMAASYIEDVLGDWTRFGSFQSSTSDASDSENASGDNDEGDLIFASDSQDASMDSWLTESTSESLDIDSASASYSDWQGSLSMGDETSDSTSGSTDRSLES